MKKTLLIQLFVLFIAIPLMAASPAGGYDDELYGRNTSNFGNAKAQFEVNAGYIAGGKLNTKSFGKVQTNLSRPYIDVIGGVRLGDYLFAGLGVGVQYAFAECKLVELATQLANVGAPETWGAVCIPIYANVRGYIPTRTIVEPYISVSLGGHVVAASNFSREGYGRLNGGLMMKFGVGLNISKFNFGIGMASQNLSWTDASDVLQFKAGNNAAYIEVGVTF